MIKEPYHPWDRRYCVVLRDGFKFIVTAPSLRVARQKAIEYVERSLSEHDKNRIHRKTH